MKKKGYYEYDPVIYPRVLWVAIGQKKADVESAFLDSDGDGLKIESEDYAGLTISELTCRKTRDMGELVVFDSKKDMTMNICCHEASHVCDAIEGVAGMKHGDEPSAYLIGWIAGCINKARLGIGKFVNIEEEEK